MILKYKLGSIVVAAALLFNVAACGGSSSTTKAASPQPSAALAEDSIVDEVIPTPSETSEVFIAKMGKDTSIYPISKLSIFVGAPVKFRPSEYAAGHNKANKAFKFKVSVANEGSEIYDLSSLMFDATLGSEGNSAERVFDEGLDTLDGSLPPGKKKTFTIAFSAASDNNHVEMSVQNFDGEVAFFEN